MLNVVVVVVAVVAVMGSCSEMRGPLSASFLPVYS